LWAVTLAYTASGQSAVVTSRGDNSRSGANTNETLLTPENVTKGSFGHLFSTPVDYQVLAQPLYVPNIEVAGQGTHNVIFVVTQADSVYAIDADDGTQLWYASMLDGGVPASGSFLPCGKLGGFTQEGIAGTPVIDLTTNIMYLVAKTVMNGMVRHELHAIDIGSGSERIDLGSPVVLKATSVSNKGHVTNFNSLHQKNRPGLLLLNGVVYIAFGSNGCNDNNSGWVLSYDATSLQQLGVFNTSPDIGLTSIWQTGAGITADPQGNIFVSTAESTNYDVQSGGQSYSNSILRLAESSVALMDYFTPWNVAFLNSNDLDVSSTSPLVLPDQDGQLSEVIAAGKQGVVYVLNRDQLGMYSAGSDSQIIQEFGLEVHGELMASPVYWNGMVYFTPDGSPLQVFQVVNGLFSPYLKTTQKLTGAHAPVVSANGSSNGILWVISGGQLRAFDAMSLKLLYTSSQAGSRDKLPALAHFASPIVANGRVYIATQTGVEAFGLFHVLSVTGGDNQSGQVLTQLPAPLEIVANNPYSGEPDAQVTVTFADGGKGGFFSPSSAVTDSNGMVSTTYTLPKKSGTFTLTASATNFGDVDASATATPAAAIKLISFGGAKQTGPAGTILPNAIVAQAQDTYKNPVPGVTVNFTTNTGVVNPTTVITDAKGQARVTLQLPTTVGTTTVTASAAGLKSIKFPEYSVAGPAASVTATGGNGQSAPVGSTLGQALTVVVADQYGNPVSGAAVTFDDGGAGGSFIGPNPATTDSTGTASVSYTLPAVPGSVTITASVAGVQTPAVFTETSQ
jgi:hypothetical protein